MAGKGKFLGAKLGANYETLSGKTRSVASNSVATDWFFDAAASGTNYVNVTDGAAISVSESTATTAYLESAPGGSTAPTPVLYRSGTAGWTSTTGTKTTATFDVVAGDVITLFSIAENEAATLTANPSATGGSITWTQEEVPNAGSTCEQVAYSGVVGTTATGITVSHINSGSGVQWNFGMRLWRDHGGIGASTSLGNNAAESIALTTTGDNSAIDFGFGNWDAVSGSGRSWLSVNGTPMAESWYSSDAAYTTLGGYVADAGAAGSKTVGINTIAGMDHNSLAAIEVKAGTGTNLISDGAAISVNDVATVDKVTAINVSDGAGITIADTSAVTVYLSPTSSTASLAHYTTAGESASFSTRNTATFTPRANSKLYVHLGRQLYANATITVSGGGLTWTRTSQESTVGSFSHYSELWEAQVGASPSSMAVTIAGGGAFSAAWSVFDILGGSLKSGQLAWAYQGSGASVPSGTLPVAATSGNLVVVCGWNNNDNAAALGAPSGFTLDGSTSGGGQYETSMVSHSTTFSSTNTTFAAGDSGNESTGLIMEFEGSSILSESVSISIADASSVSASGGSTPVDVTETNSLSISDSSAVEVRLSVSETSSLSIADASTNSSALSVSETRSLAAADSSSNAVGSTVTEAAALSIVDASSVAVSITVSDSSALTIADASTNSSSLSVSESRSLAISETSANDSSLSVSETSAVSVVDLSGVATSVGVSDTGAIAVADTSGIAISTAVPVTDTSALSIADTSTNVVSIAVTDTSAFTISDASAITAQRSVTDTAAISIADTSSPSAAIATTDTSAISIADISAISSGRTVTDTAAISIAESISGDAAVGVTDTAAISVSEAVVAGSSLPGQETIGLAITDIATVTVYVSGAESASIAISETSQPAVSVAVSESRSLAVSDTSAIASDRAVTDTAALSIADSLSYQLADSKSISDTASIAVSEASSITVYFNVSDTSSIAISEASANSSALAVTDTSSLAISESVVTGKSFPVSDTAAIAVTDIASTAVANDRSDTSAIAVTESSSVVAYLSVSEQAAISVSEAVAIAASMSVADTGAINIVDQSAIASSRTVTDTSALSISEVVAIASDRLVSDSAAISVSDTSELTKNISVSDTLKIFDTDPEVNMFTGISPASTQVSTTTPTELGIKFIPSVNGQVNGIRFYKGTLNTGTHTGSLWASDGTLLATVTFTGETASGWQQMLFSSPVAVTAGTTYVASYFAPNGRWARTQDFFALSPWVKGKLTAPAGTNGVTTLSGAGFPTLSNRSSNYFVDPVFQYHRDDGESSSVAQTAFINVSDGAAISISDVQTYEVTLAVSESSGLSITEQITIDMVQGNVLRARYGGAWVIGTLWVYTGGSWQQKPMQIYKDGVWV